MAAYSRWGEACPERLVGDFAFSIWDGKRQRHFCARDTFGVKPFYFHHSDAGFAWATDVESLLRLPYVSSRLDPLGVADLLMGFHRDKTRTPYRDVRRLAPAHSLTVDARGIRKRTYWQPDPAYELRLGSDAEYDEAFRSEFGTAVGDRLRGSGRPGTTLSGGLDSSAVTAMAQLLSTAPVPAFSTLFDTVPASDERPYARSVVAHTGAVGHECRADDLSPLADWEGAPWRGAEPGINPQIAVTRACQTGARREGVTVLLTGFGGDDVVSHGLGYLTELVASARLPRFLNEAQALSYRGQRPLSRVVRSAVQPLLPPAVMRTVRTIRGQEPVWPLENPIRPDVVRRLGIRARVADLTADLCRARTQRQAHALSLTSGLLPTALESIHRTDAVFGVEHRHPFLDRRLAELCLSLPPEQKLRNGWTRLIMRRSLAGILPDEVRWRPGKADLSHAFQAGLRTKDRPTLQDVVAHPGPIAEWVEPRYLADLYERCLTRGQKGDWFTLWRVAVMALWLREQRVDIEGR